ncbi:tissue factor pathway inhibitor isoform X1 [Equus asinus]|uniref:Tissue factor pathway inhibitor n=2 Tax=Equus TaxID=9789 RepID=A0A5F5PPB7_HORSE|nr:PREDICTED: tissue factor pathway inhibitor isoform X1 [Equus przewalskii]XP_008516782.1 PREDICTED: tissue factor pathway inhibitor isoform X1 [Equus przewalskii]XP_014588057.1 tissue factor pathway inhibitor isoform X1 [Equus caballus]XP_014708395.1 tissue factor pathway inhibitor isoform X1 [Equus asinus]XP_044624526.1 tissue factor pathway inhibitor isoform X1 [Equus asinus]
MIYTMKKEQICWASICLLLGCASAPLNAAPQESEEHTNITDAELPPLKPLHSFCALKADDGPCRAMIKRFFFNIHTQQCEEFVYGGCEGNQNRFESLEECKEKCIRVYPKKSRRTEGTLQKEKPDFCFLEEDAGICRGYITRYFYNNQSKQCERFKYGGCLGNLNNFDSLEECKNACEDALNDFQVDDHRTQINAVNNDSLTPQPTKVPNFWEFYGPSWCLTPADRGLCQANESRFYYNSIIGKCRPFKYSGCGGNENNFTSKRACLKACKKGFIQRISKEGLIKTKRKRKKQPVKIVYEKIFVKKT